MEYIDIEKENIPYEFDIKLLDKTYTFTINYNSLFDFFTVDLSLNEKIIVLGEKLVYGNPLFSNAKYKDIPGIDIVPFDLAGKESIITYENLNESVFLYLVGG